MHIRAYYIAQVSGHRNVKLMLQVNGVLAFIKSQ